MLGQMIGAMLSQPKNQPTYSVELAPGQILKGKILKLFPENTALVQMGGLKITARLQASLSVGQWAWLQVQKSSDPVTLKVLTEQARSGVTTTTPPTVEGLLRMLKLPDTQEMQALVRQMINEQVPLTRKNILAFQNLSRLPQLPKEWLPVAAMMVRKNIPVQPETFRSVFRFVENENIRPLLQEWQKAAASFLNRTSGANAGSERAPAEPVRSGNMPLPAETGGQNAGSVRADSVKQAGQGVQEAAVIKPGSKGNVQTGPVPLEETNAAMTANGKHGAEPAQGRTRMPVSERLVSRRKAMKKQKAFRVRRRKEIRFRLLLRLNPVRQHVRSRCGRKCGRMWKNCSCI